MYRCPPPSAQHTNPYLLHSPTPHYTTKGLPPTDPMCVAAHAFIQKHGGAIMAPSWCKFWLVRGDGLSLC